MNEKKLSSRIQQKHDTEANWLKATNFTPRAGELIIYDVDNMHSTPRFKVGDGSTSVSDLPFVNGTMKFDADGFSYEDYGGNIGTFSPTNIILSDLIYKAAYDTTSISYKNISTDVEYDLNFPTKSGTFAVTSDIDITAASNNTFTGTNTFQIEDENGSLYRTLINKDGVSVGGGPAASGILIDVTYGLDNIKRLYGGTTYTYTFPNKSSMLATMDDIPIAASLAKVSQDNTFTGKNLINTDPVTLGGLNRYKTIDFSNYDSIKVGWKQSNTLDSNWYNYTRYADGVIYRSATGTGEVPLTLPVTAAGGTLALTSDIPIKSASLDGTTLSITLS